MKSRLFFFLKALSSLIGIAGAVFVGLQVFQYSEQLKLFSLPDNILLIIIIVSTVYGFSNFFLAIGWHQILTWLDADIRVMTSIRIYSLSQLGKYVPGNIFQFVGRHALAFSEGIPNGKLAKSTFFEFAALILAGLICFPLAINYLAVEISIELILGLFISILSLALIVLWLFLGVSLSKAYACYLIFLLCSGLCFAFIFSAVSQQPLVFSKTVFLVGVYVLGWLAGLLSPGAPAGLGVREAVLTVMLATVAPASVILLSVLISRLSTVVGDILFFVIGQTPIFRKSNLIFVD